MSYTETRRTGFFSGIKNAVVGGLLGLVLVPGSVALLSWNEYRTIHRTRGLNEGADQVETVADPDNASPQFAGTLIHVNEKADTDERLSDKQFGIEENAIRLIRNVETYQWSEHKSTDKTGNTERTTYNYRQEWSAHHIDHHRFKKSVGHENPPPRFKESEQLAKKVKVGGYLLNQNLIESIDSAELVPWSQEMLAAAEKFPGETSVSDKYLYSSENGSTPESPSVGDQRIWFEVVKPTRVSFVSGVSEASADQLKPFKVSNGETLERLYVGDFSAAEVFEKMRNENQATAWMIRVGGFAMSFFGFSMILGVLSAFTNWIPVVGSMTRAVFGFVAFLLAVVLTTLTIAFAWIAVRPLIAIPLIVIAIGAAFMAWRSTRKSPNPALVPATEAPVVLGAEDVV